MLVLELAKVLLLELDSVLEEVFEVAEILLRPLEWACKFIRWLTRQGRYGSG